MRIKKHSWIYILISIIIEISFNLVYGFVIGGEINVLYYVLNVVVAVFTLGLVFWFDHIDIMDIGFCIFVVLVAISLNALFYDAENHWFADDSTAISYTADVIEYSNVSRTTNAYVTFKTPSGENGGASSHKYKYDENLADKDIEVIITEKTGGFNYQTYTIDDLHIKSQKFIISNFT